MEAARVNDYSHQPIIYTNTVEVQHSDLDANQRVPASRYLEYVIASRARCLEKCLRMSSVRLTKNSLGFHLVNSNITFKNPGDGPQTLHVESAVRRVEQTKLNVGFSIRHITRFVAVGTLEYTIMDLDNDVAQPLPSWAHALFWDS